MTLNDIIMRDLEIARRDEERRVAAEGLAAYEREINRRLWRRRVRAACEFIGGCLTVVIAVALIVGCIACSGYHWE